MPNFEKPHQEKEEPSSKETYRSNALEKANELFGELSKLEEMERKESPDKTQEQQLREVALRLIIESLRGKTERVSNMAHLIANINREQ